MYVVVNQPNKQYREVRHYSALMKPGGGFEESPPSPPPPAPSSFSWHPARRRRPIYASIPYFASRFHNSTHQAGRQACGVTALLIVFPFRRRGPRSPYKSRAPSPGHLHTRQLRHLNFSADKVRLKRYSETNYRTKCDAFQIALTYSPSPSPTQFHRPTGEFSNPM